MRASLLAALVAGALLASSLGLTVFASAGARAATPLRSLRIGEAGLTILTFNPMKITLTDEYVVAYNVYSTLVTYNKSYGVVPDLASSWVLASDQVTWTFHLVQGAYFLDPANPANASHTVTAADVVFSYNLQMSLTGSVFHQYTTEMVSVTQVDTYTVKIVTQQPFAPMYAALAAVPILPQYIWATVSNPINYNPLYPIGSSAMYYDYTNSTASLLILRKNPGYYGPANYGRQVRPDEVRFIAYSSTSTLVNDFLSGANSLDAIEGLSQSDYASTLGGWTPKWGVDEGFVGEFSINLMTDAERSGLISAGLNQFRNGANNQILATNWTVRRAIAMSINRTALIHDALLGLGSVGDTLVPDTNAWHYSEPANRQYAFNTSAARAMLNAAGWKYDAGGGLNPSATPLYQAGGTNGLVFRFYSLNTGSEWKVAAQDIVGWLAQTGVETTNSTGNPSPGYTLASINQMSGYWLSGDYDLWLWDWVFSPGSDPSLDILSIETTMAIGPTSDNFYSNATYDGLYNESLTAMNPVVRRGLTDSMQDMIYQDSSYILPYYRFSLFAALDPSSPGLGTTARWTNWGNWNQDPGLAPDSDLPNLWFQVQPPGPDTTPPATTIHLSGTGGQGGWFTSSVQVTLSATDDLTGVASTIYSIDGGAWQTYTVPFTLASDGNHTVRYHSTDGAGNVETNHLASIPIDTAPPTDHAAASGTLGDAGWYVTAATVRLNATDNTSGVSSVSYRIDGATWTPYAAPFTLSDGVHAVDYRSVDAAGNTAATQSLAVKVDTTPPILTDLAPSGHVTTSAVRMTWAGSDAVSGIAGYAISVDGGAFQDLGTNETTSLTLADGTHTITVRARDVAGHTTIQTTTVTVDTNLLSFTGPYAGLPTIAILVVAVAALGTLLWAWRRKRPPEPHPEQPPPPPPGS